MSVYTGTSYNGPAAGPGERSDRSSRHCGARWKPLEILAMILGFIVFWPIGLAIVLWKIWQRSTGYEGDLGSFLQEKWQAKAAHNWNCGGFGSNGRHASRWGMRPTGNRAFDEWRDAELARLEEEHRKLVAAEREFAEYMENLRRARDREEFDRFMNERRNRHNDAPSGPSVA